MTVGMLVNPATLADIRLCNHFTPDKYCDSTATGICVALRGQPCKWLDEVVRPLAPYGYIERKEKP